MRASLLFGLLATGAMGCASLSTPHAPIVTTVQGRRCVQQCRSLYDRCASRANELVAQGSYWSFANPALDSCNENLGRCYAICPG